MNSNRFFTHSVIGLALGAMSFTAALAAGPVGELEIRGSVRIGQQAEPGAVTLRDTAYGWFSGDRIETRDGHAVLSLDDGGSFGFGRDTEATLAVVDGQIQVELDSGVLLYAIEGDATELAVASGDYRFSTHSGEARPIQVASDTPMSAGTIEVLDNGEVRVTVQEGRVEASDASGSLNYQVSTGEAVEFAGSEPRQVEVQVEAARPEDEDDDGAVAWMRDNPALTGLIIAAGAFGIYRVFFDDDDDDPAPISP